MRALTRVEDFNEFFECELSDEEYDTVGGLVMHELGRLPRRGERVDFGGFEFAVMMPGSSLFEINGDSATGHWYLQEFTRDLEGNAASILSRYRDTYTRVDGQWLYQSRHYDVMYFGPADLSAPFTPLPE